jgi:hypothetical protein
MVQTPSGATAPLIGVIGAGTADAELAAQARELGRGLAEAGLGVVCGGLGGVMAAVCQGAAEAGGVTVGILPGPSPDDANAHVTVPIATNMGHARNVIIAHTARVLVAVGGSHGTRSEVSIGLKLGCPVVSLHSFDFDPAIIVVDSPRAAVDAVLRALGQFS